MKPASHATEAERLATMSTRVQEKGKRCYSLPQAERPGGGRRRPRYGWWRAATLLLVYVLIGAHIIHWKLAGKTLAPLELNEVMYTLELGIVTAGFLFMVATVTATLIFGRFFCSWGCHILALEDLCAWVMRRLKIRPKPWRTRLLVLMPLVLMSYMFVWPHLKRLLVWVWPEAVSVVGRSPNFSLRIASEAEEWASFVTTDFWRNLPGPGITILTFAICGFAIVYLLGSRSFCRYVCPYGAVFGLADRVAPGRIKVNDSCEQSGHCTGVCTSNIRVHEEVRDFGMVVDPGCMKCLDCVSVCPNEALSFGFGTPPALARPRDAAARDRVKARKKRAHAFDLTWPEEIAFGVVFIALTFSYRGLFNVIPLLMAAGLGAIATFIAWKLWRMVVTPNVRLQNLKARYRGRTTRAGLVLATAGSAVVLVGVWSGVVRYHLWRGSMLDASLMIRAERVLTIGYTPDPVIKRVAERAVDHYRIAGPPRDGGIGWNRRPGEEVRYAWLLSVAGRFDEAEAVLMDVADRHEADMDLVESILLVMRVRGATGDELREVLGRIATRHPRLLPLQVLIARDEARSGLRTEALERVRRVVAEAGDDVASLGPAVELMASLGRVDEALIALHERVAQSPRRADLRLLLGIATAASGDPAGALAQLETAAQLAPDNPTILLTLANLLEASGDTPGADRLRKRVLEQHGGDPAPP